jgi:hypothetical protein
MPNPEFEHLYALVNHPAWEDYENFLRAKKISTLESALKVNDFEAFLQAKARANVYSELLDLRTMILGDIHSTSPR